MGGLKGRFCVVQAASTARHRAKAVQIHLPAARIIELWYQAQIRKAWLRRPCNRAAVPTVREAPQRPARPGADEMLHPTLHVQCTLAQPRCQIARPTGCRPGADPRQSPAPAPLDGPPRPGRCGIRPQPTGRIQIAQNGQRLREAAAHQSPARARGLVGCGPDGPAPRWSPDHQINDAALIGDARKVQGNPHPVARRRPPIVIENRIRHPSAPRKRVAARRQQGADCSRQSRPRTPCPWPCPSAPACRRPR